MFNKFDQLCKQQEVQSARETIAQYGRHLVRTDIPAADVEWLGRAYRAQIARLAVAKVSLTEWWS